MTILRRPAMMIHAASAMLHRRPSPILRRSTGGALPRARAVDKWDCRAAGSGGGSLHRRRASDAERARDPRRHRSKPHGGDGEGRPGTDAQVARPMTVRKDRRRKRRHEAAGGGTAASPPPTRGRFRRAARLDGDGRRRNAEMRPAHSPPSSGPRRRPPSRAGRSGTGQGSGDPAGTPVASVPGSAPAPASERNAATRDGRASGRGPRTPGAIPRKPVSLTADRLPCVQAPTPAA